MAKIPDVILIHGAWADGSSWAKVIPLLQAQGLSVTAVQLPLTSFENDAATARRAIALVNGPIVLVGHSYGGAVITEAGTDLNVAALVYVAAFAPDVGQSAGSLGASVAPAPIAEHVRPDKEGYLKLTSTGIKENFAQDLTDVEKNGCWQPRHRLRVLRWEAMSPLPRGSPNPARISLRRATEPYSLNYNGRWRRRFVHRRLKLPRAMSRCFRTHRRRQISSSRLPPDERRRSDDKRSRWNCGHYTGQRKAHLFR